MPNYRLTLEYEGTRYSGWQTQKNTAKTVQGRLIDAATQVFGNVEVSGAGRTDAGVHAAAQVAHLRTPRKEPVREIARKLNDLLPHDIHIIRVDVTQDRFHSRHDAKLRVYLYQISTRRAALAKPFVWWIKDELDLDRMKAAAQLLPGMHDFSAFTDRRAVNESTRVLVVKAELGRSDDLILFRIAASHFLWKMVRKVVAALVEVGRGAMTVDEFRILVERPGAPFQPSAPSSGLFLEAILYEKEDFERPLVPIVPVKSPRSGE